MRLLPSLDLHAHVDVSIDPSELVALRAVVFCATRSIREADIAMKRSDELAVWGVGTHPGLAGSLATYDESMFASLLDSSAYVSEVGFDGKVLSRLAQQREVLRSILAILQRKPRLTCLHSFGACDELLMELEARPIKGAVLHWWLGDRLTTLRALRLGAYFSVNAACVRRSEFLDNLPLSRILPETDHPAGNRYSTQPRRPGAVGDVEIALGRHYGIDPAEVRRVIWRNLADLVVDTGCGSLLPRRVRVLLATSHPSH